MRHSSFPAVVHIALALIALAFLHAPAQAQDTWRRVKSTGTNAGNVYVTLDGQTGFEMADGDEVAITRAERPLRLVRASARSYFEVLRQKLKWNER